MAGINIRCHTHTSVGCTLVCMYACVSACTTIILLAVSAAAARARAALALALRGGSTCGLLRHVG